jgi:hypothetical protein
MQVEPLGDFWKYYDRHQDFSDVSGQQRDYPELHEVLEKERETYCLVIQNCLQRKKGTPKRVYKAEGFFFKKEVRPDIARSRKEDGDLPAFISKKSGLPPSKLSRHSCRSHRRLPISE